MKKTTLIWTVIALLGVSVVLELLSASVIAITQNISLYYGSHIALDVLAVIFLLVDICITAFYIIKLWNLTGDVLFWTNAQFGWSVFRGIFSIFADIVSDKGTQFGNLAELMVIMAVWLVFYSHLKRLLYPKDYLNGASQIGKSV